MTTHKKDEDAVLCLVTCPNDDVAEALGRTLVVERLAACVNILPSVRSIYRWHGSITDEVEFLLIKTTRDHFEKLRARVVSLHPYDVPEIVMISVAEVHEPYLSWLRSSVGEE